MKGERFTSPKTPSTIPKEGLSDQQKFIQPAPTSLSTRFKKIEEHLRSAADHKLKELWLKNYKEKSGNNLFYLIGLLIILGILLMLFRDKRPAGIGVKMGLQRSHGLRKRTVLFNVCCKDYPTDAAFVLGKIIGRRMREKGTIFRIF